MRFSESMRFYMRFSEFIIKLFTIIYIYLFNNESFYPSVFFDRI
jgi:hypothetical protein